MSVVEKCIRCGNNSTFACDKCLQYWYCSKPCQKQHWCHGHSGQCKLLTRTEKRKEIATNEDQLKEASKTITKPLWPFERMKTILKIKPQIMNDDSIGGGLKNVGNTCFVNSVLQCLMYTTPLQLFLRSFDHPKECPLEAAEKFCLVCTFRTLLKKMLDGGFEWVMPREILLNLGSMSCLAPGNSLLEIGQDFELGRQEDAHEFNSRMLEVMHQNLLNDSKSIMSNVKERSRKMRLEETTAIYQIFSGHLISNVRCTECGSITSSLESFVDLNVDLGQHASCIEEALSNFCEIEVIPKSVGYKCAKCDKAVTVQKQLSILDAPNILTVQLKRFNLMRGGLKINKSIVFPEVLDLDEIGIMSEHAVPKENPHNQYELYGVIVHYGSTIFGGHYTSFIKLEGEWYLFDDEKVHHVDRSIVFKQNAYILYYKRMTEPYTKKVAESQQKLNDSLGGSMEIEKVDLSATLSLLTPSFSSFVYEEEDIMLDIKMRINLPKETDKTFMSSGKITIAPDGKFVLHSQHYFLMIELPFQLNVNTASCIYFNHENVLWVVLPLSQDVIEGSEAVEVAASFEDKLASFNIFQEGSPLDVDPKLVDKGKLSEEDERFLLSIERIEKLNLESSSLGALYKNIRELNRTRERKLEGQPTAKSGPAKTATAKGGVAKQKKVGPNDKCPCGSNQKYKKCHGSK